MFDNIIVYSREHAIEDGVLIDVTVLANKIGLIGQVVVTSTVWDDYIDKVDDKKECSAEFQRAENAALLLRAVYQAVLFKSQSKAEFCEPRLFSYDLEVGGKKQEVELKIICEDVITILKPDED